MPLTLATWVNQCWDSLSIYLQLVKASLSICHVENPSQDNTLTRYKVNASKMSTCTLRDNRYHV